MTAIDTTAQATPAATTTPDLGAVKRRQQATWASGDYHVIGTQIVLVAEQLVEGLDLRATDRVLDVATGRWTLLPEGGPPEARADAVGVPDGRQVLVLWGSGAAGLRVDGFALR